MALNPSDRTFDLATAFIAPKGTPLPCYVFCLPPPSMWRSHLNPMMSRLFVKTIAARRLVPDRTRRKLHSQHRVENTPNALALALSCGDRTDRHRGEDVTRRARRSVAPQRRLIADGGAAAAQRLTLHRRLRNARLGQDLSRVRKCCIVLVSETGVRWRMASVRRGIWPYTLYRLSVAA